ncbi:unnamed protein product [Allacma fusca]|uniref:XK-related protein n=1 Tax=Allacma fusca TaxID=39272 RepID=A0A8J2KQ83_9HEXA|nr:unnamed protein product [Allacma fusca]
MTQQNTNVLVTKFTKKWTEHLYNFLMAGVHIFCFLNVFVNQTRYRLILFYVLQFIEDFGFLCLWYIQLLTEPVHYQSWIYHLGAAIYVNAFAIGICAMVAFYLILHPNMTEPLRRGVSPLKKSTPSFFELFKIKLNPTRNPHMCTEENPPNSECCSDSESSSDVDIIGVMGIK